MSPAQPDPGALRTALTPLGPPNAQVRTALNTPKTQSQTKQPCFREAILREVKHLLSHEDVLSRLDYDPETGVFRHKISNRRARKGAVAGHRTPDGYVHMGVNRHPCLAHRLAWFYVHGEWPAQEIDHINGDRADNRIANLRLATRSQNAANCKLPSSNTSGYKGVHWEGGRKNKWCARIYAAGCYKSLGLFTRKEDAAEAYRKAAEEYYGEFARTE